MSIKRQESASGPTVPSAEACVVMSGHPVPVIRFELTDRTVSYVAVELKRWELIPGEPDKLVIRAGGEVISIVGRNLAPAHDALDNARLQILREAPSRRAAFAFWTKFMRRIRPSSNFGTIGVAPRCARGRPHR